MKAEPQGNISFQTILANLNVFEPKIFCESGNEINRMCTNSSCAASLVCSQVKCLKCGVNKHPTCLIVSLPGITTLLNKRVDVYKQVVSNVFSVDEDFVYSIRDSREEHIKKSYLSRDPRFQMVVEDIYKKKNSTFLTGRLAKDFYQKLQQQSNISSFRVAQLTQTYRTQMNRIFLSVVKVKEWLYEQFLNEFHLDSAILTKSSQEDKQKVQYLREVLQNPKELHLLYRASEHNFSADFFHKKCDNLTDTLTLVKTQFGKTIAGFSKYPWNAAKEDWVHDAKKQAFLLSLDLKEKMSPISRYKLVYCSSKCGPTFGGGPDLKIADGCHKNEDSFTNFPTTYNTHDLRFQKNEQTLSRFAGNPDGQHFRVLEYEVFRVIESDFKLVEPPPQFEDKSPKDSNRPESKKVQEGDSGPQSMKKRKKSDSFCSIQ